MAVPEIVAIGECVKELGKEGSATPAELALVAQKKLQAERLVRQWLRCSVVQPSSDYTHILPPVDDQTYRFRQFGDVEERKVLRLPEYPVRSITSIYEDENALGGAASGAFPSSSLLTDGQDFFLDISQSGFAKFGRVIRQNNYWPVLPGSIKVTYAAGWSADELDGNVTDPGLDASDIKAATLLQFVAMFNESVQQQSTAGGAGPIEQERLHDYSVKYAMSGGGAAVALTGEVKNILRPHRRPVVG